MSDSDSDEEFNIRPPPLSVAIKSILKRYPDGQIFKVSIARLEYTVEPLYNGQIRDWPFVPCSEVVPFSEVIIVSLLYHKINDYRGKYCARKSYRKAIL